MIRKFLVFRIYINIYHFKNSVREISLTEMIYHSPNAVKNTREFRKSNQEPGVARGARKDGDDFCSGSQGKSGCSIAAMDCSINAGVKLLIKKFQ